MKTKVNWIKITDTSPLPDFEKNVLLYCRIDHNREDKEVFKYFAVDTLREVIHDSNGRRAEFWNNSDVTHYAELPEAPED